MSTLASTATRGPRWPGTAGDADLLAAIDAAVSQAAARPGRTLISTVVPVETVDPVALFAAVAATDHERALWLQPDRGFALLGIGSAWTLRASGAARFRQVAAAWSALSADAVVHGPSDQGRGPLLLGGFGFADAAARSATWRGFEMAEVVLPALLVTVTAGGTWLTASHVLPADDPGEGVATALASMWSTLSGAARTAAHAQGQLTTRATLHLAEGRPDAAAWRASVSRMAGAVGRGRLDKVVLARQVRLVSATPLDVPSVMERLRGSAPESTLFALGREGRTFLGASPERLVSVDGRHMRSVAMAGSMRRGGDQVGDERLAAELLASNKEREEHAVVVDMLRATLSPFTEELAIPAVPHVERLRHLQHLVTPVEGQLREPMSVLRLGELLHPTPAVGGMPRDLALELIAEEEQLERGWYAGPLGWVDRMGDGELVVALRSGVVEERTATLLAGCGIVADSDPEREWQESTTKLLALGSALGRVEV